MQNDVEERSEKMNYRRCKNKTEMQRFQKAIKMLIEQYSVYKSLTQMVVNLFRCKEDWAEQDQQILK